MSADFNAEMDNNVLGSDRYTFDFDAVETNDLIQPGIYVAEVTNMEVNVGQDSGIPYYRITFSVTLDDSGATTELEDCASFHPKAIKITYTKLCTLAGERLRGSFNMHRDREQFLKRQVRLNIKYDRKDPNRNTVVAYLPLESLSTLPGYNGASFGGDSASRPPKPGLFS